MPSRTRQTAGRLDLVHLLVQIARVIKLNIHEAKTHLSEHLDRLERGDEDVVVICRRNEPIAEIRALRRRGKVARAIFRRDRRFKLSRSFFSPLPDALLAAFEGET